MTETEINQLSSRIIGAAINIHKELGPGLFESVYSACMVNEPTLSSGVQRILNTPSGDTVPRSG